MKDKSTGDLDYQPSTTSKQNQRPRSVARPRGSIVNTKNSISGTSSRTANSLRRLNMHLSKDDVKREKVYARLENDKILNRGQVTPSDLLQENAATSITVIPQIPRANMSKTIADEHTQGT